MFPQLFGGTSSVPDGVVSKGTENDDCIDTGWRYCGDTCIEYETRYRDAYFLPFLKLLTYLLTS